MFWLLILRLATLASQSQSFLTDLLSENVPSTLDDIGLIWTVYHQLGKHVLAAMHTQLGDRAWLSAQIRSVETFINNLPQVCASYQVMMILYSDL